MKKSIRGRRCARCYDCGLRRRIRIPVRVSERYVMWKTRLYGCEQIWTKKFLRFVSVFLRKYLVAVISTTLNELPQPTAIRM